MGWNQHHNHHLFYNPSPFSVIADDMFDQFMRALPLLAFPLLMPINMDMMFLMYGIFFYGYGVYLHTGYEIDWIVDAHHPIINSAFQHYIHHARSTAKTPYHTGFFFKIWDQLLSTCWPDYAPKTCSCSKCCRARGERSIEAWKELQPSIPSYAPLLSPSYWLKSLSAK